ncbi:Tyrosine-protein kinase [Parasponia andersonii]|uniref:Tyrosine-protein kinase n=1 Tax=Parasponia andersonii TaxID=3476 RepID=A0A2P5ATS3_PARAD|nr:Tyrosine-protein kinase [Parasponia andersonii]
MSQILSEFAYMSKVTTKVDVFSFGTIVMEFLTKQRPTGLIEEDGMPISLRQLVEKALENGRAKLLQILDPELVLSVYKQQEEILEELFKLALFCTNPNPEDRPNMKDVVSTLLKLKSV